MKTFAPLLFTLALTACSTGGGGTVLPSPVGDLAVSRACRDAPPDVIPSAPITATSIWFYEGMGSAADSLELLRMGFERVRFTVTDANMAAAAKLSSNDTSRWSQVPLTSQAGTVTLEVAPRGDPRCAAFEREVEAQRAKSDDPMKFWTDMRFPPAGTEGRNWCIATLNALDPAALLLSREVSTTREGQSNVSVRLEILTDVSSNLLARRTQVWMNRPSFPIGVSSVATGCDGQTIGPTPEFFGPTGIALRPAASPTLINK